MTFPDRNDTQLFRSLFDNLSDAVFLFAWTEQGAPGRFVELNQRACQLLGYTRDELMTLSCAAILPPERSAEYGQAFRSLATNASLLFQTTLVSKSGNGIPVEVSSQLSTWNHAPVVVCVARDLTPHQQVEAELRQRLDLERLIADISTDLAHSTLETFESATRHAMQVIGEFIAADRCYLTLLREGAPIIESSLDWCAPGLESTGTRYKGISIDRFGWTLERFTHNETIQVDEVSALPAAATAEKETWGAGGVQSLVAIPIFLENALAGYLGFNIEHQPVEKKWSDLDFRLLRVMADLFASALARTRYEARRASLNCDLERRVSERTAQWQESEAKFRALAQRVVLMQEEERHRIARELHDDAGQSLNVLKIRLSLLRAEMAGDANKPVRQMLDDALGLADRTLESIHTLAQGLRPAGLDTVGLHLSVEELCREFARQTRLPVNYRGEPVTGLDDTATISLYRFLQEALTNVVKHAHAHQVWVTLERNAHHATLAVRDDGQGFDATVQLRASADQLGLQNLRERFEMLGGDLAIEAQIGQGTCLTAHVPLQEHE